MFVKRRPAASFESSIQEISGVELQAGLGGVNLHYPAALWLVDAGGELHVEFRVGCHLDVEIAINEYDQNQWEIEIWNG